MSDDRRDLDFNAGAVAGSSKAKNANANTSTNAEISLPDNVYGGYSQFDYGDANVLDAGEFGGFDEGFELGILEEDEMMLDMLPEDGDAMVDPKDPKGKKRARSDDGESDDESVEAGRDAPASVGHASARGSIPGLGEKGDDELDGEGDVTMQSGAAPFDFGGDMGGMEDADFQFDEFGGGEDPVEQRATSSSQFHRQFRSVAESAFAAPRMESPDQESFALTPKTAADLAKVAPRSQQKGKSVKKQVVDRVTELEWESGARAAQKENLFVEVRSRVVAAFVPFADRRILCSLNIFLATGSISDCSSCQTRSTESRTTSLSRRRRKETISTPLRQDSLPNCRSSSNSLPDAPESPLTLDESEKRLCSTRMSRLDDSPKVDTRTTRTRTSTTYLLDTSLEEEQRGTRR